MPTALMVGGSLAGGALGAFGSMSASNTMANYGQQALGQLNSILGPIIAQGKGIVNTALGPLAKLLTPGAGQGAELAEMPGFQFAQQWGQQAVKNLGTTMGLGGNTLKAGADYATGLASNTYGTIVSQLQNLLNSGASLETSGANSLASGTTSALTGIGQAKAGGVLGATNALSGAATGVGNAGVIGQLLSKLNGSSPNNNSSAGIYGGGDVNMSDTSGASWG